MSDAVPPDTPGPPAAGSGTPGSETPGSGTPESGTPGSGSPAPGTGDGPGTGPRRRPARKRFILVGFAIGIVIVVLVGLFTSIGSSGNSSGQGSSGGTVQAGDPVPTFTKANVGPVGPRLVHVSPSAVAGRPTVLLFFGAWCTACQSELPPLAARVHAQAAAGGALAHIRVVGVDSLDAIGDAKSFIAHAGVTFPVAYDYDAVVTENDFGFKGDPYTVFVKADGTVAKVVAGAQLTPASFTAAERSLIPSGK